MSKNLKLIIALMLAYAVSTVGVAYAGNAEDAGKKIDKAAERAQGKTGEIMEKAGKKAEKEGKKLQD